MPTLADVDQFLATKFSAVYANFGIFLTLEGTKYATASGGL